MNGYLRDIVLDGEQFARVLTKADILYVLMNLGLASDAEQALDMYIAIKGHDSFQKVKSGFYSVDMTEYLKDVSDSDTSSVTSSGKRKRVVLSGTLWKRGNIFWNKRYFLLKGKKLAYFDSPVSNILTNY